tara:strand:+ start:721 stop:1134 length:414 start_codon:yes stop_codon:yes gene_type:complete
MPTYGQRLARRTNRIGKRASSFFTKTSDGAKKFFTKGGEGQQILGGFSKGLSEIGKVASSVASNPLTVGLAGMVAPELLPVVAGLGLAGKVGSQLGNASDISTYKGNANTVGANVLERIKAVKSTVQDRDKGGIAFV